MTNILVEMRETGEKLSKLRYRIDKFDQETELKLQPALQKIADYKEQRVEESKDMRVQRDELSAQLLKLLQEAQLQNIKLKDGSTFFRKQYTGWGIADQEKALEYAAAHDLLKTEIRKADLNKHLDELSEIPEGFERTVKENIEVRIKNESDETPDK